jgi:RND family efflux transporter MFP subunit
MPSCRAELTGWIFFLLFLLPLPGCRNRQQDHIPRPLPEVRTLTACRESVQPRLLLFGTVVQHSKADVFAAGEGHIESLLVEEGDKVARGQILARLDRTRLLIRHREAEAEVESKRALLQLTEQKLLQGKRDVEARLIAVENARAELAQRQTECAHIAALYENKKQLFEAGGISREDLETVKTRYAGAKNELAKARGDLAIQEIGFRAEDIRAAGYELPATEEQRRELLAEINTGTLQAERRVGEAELSSALAQLEAIDLLLEETAVRAPIAGIVGARYREEGEKTSTRERLFTILNTDRVYVQADVSEKDLSRIKTGQRAAVTLDHAAVLSVQGVVKLISPYLDPETRTGRVRVEVANKDGFLTPGSFVRLSIVTGSVQEHIVLPRSAVLLDERGESYVFVLRDNRLFKQGVELAAGLPEKAMVIRGIEEGEIICGEPSPAYSDGMEVAVSP